MSKHFFGNASETGFMIGDIGGIKVKTRNYGKEEKKKEKKKVRLEWLRQIVQRGWIFSRGVKETYSSLSPREKSREELIQLREKEPEIWRAKAEYHACEHKLIHLLEEGKEVSLENLQAALAQSPNCRCGELQDSILAEPSLEKLMETLEVAKEYFEKREEYLSLSILSPVSIFWKNSTSRFKSP